MLSALISSTDGPAAITVGESPEPEPAPGMVVIDVVYAGVSFPDVLLSRGEYQLQPPLPFIPGSEVAGVVRSAPDGSALAAGDAHRPTVPPPAPLSAQADTAEQLMEKYGIKTWNVNWFEGNVGILPYKGINGIGTA